MSINDHEPMPVRQPGMPAVWLTIIEELSTCQHEDTVLDQIVQDMRERNDIGTQRYGGPLLAHDGRNSMVDAYQELLDALVYTRKALMELPEDGGTYVRWALHNVYDETMKSVRIMRVAIIAKEKGW